MTKQKNGLTRRRFLERVGVAGGSVALYETMTALGLINLPEAWAGPPQLPAGSGTGKKVVILGAGIGGLTAAYELAKANYTVQIIEITERAGGRNLSARSATSMRAFTSILDQVGFPIIIAEFFITVRYSASRSRST
jgi:monoamine oxidase